MQIRLVLIIRINTKRHLAQINLRVWRDEANTDLSALLMTDQRDAIQSEGERDI